MESLIHSRHAKGTFEFGLGLRDSFMLSSGASEDLPPQGVDWGMGIASKDSEHFYKALQCLQVTQSWQFILLA